MPNPRSTGLSGLDAQNDFLRARRRAASARLAAKLRLEPDDVGMILPYEEVVAALGFVSEHRVGLRVIPLDLIVGTVDRSRDFDRQFRPTSARVRSRWEQIAAAVRQGEAMPPIDVLRIGEICFVRDGHHRVSVAQALGHGDIDAYVTDVVTRVGADRTITLTDLPLKTHERVFFERVPLADEARQRIQSLSDPWDYGTLAESVEAWGFRASADHHERPRPRRDGAAVVRDRVRARGGDAPRGAHARRGHGDRGLHARRRGALPAVANEPLGRGGPAAGGRGTEARTAVCSARTITCASLRPLCLHVRSSAQPTREPRLGGGMRRGCRRAARREQLIDAALSVILELGYGGVSIEAIARAAGVTRPVIYDHFPNLGRCFTRWSSARSLLEEQLERVVPDDPGDSDPVEVLAGRAWRVVLDAVTARPTTWRIILLPLDGTPAIVRQHVETHRARILERIERLVHWAINRNELPSDLDVELTARAIRDLGGRGRPDGAHRSAAVRRLTVTSVSCSR